MAPALCHRVDDSATEWQLCPSGQTRRWTKAAGSHPRSKDQKQTNKEMGATASCNKTSASGHPEHDDPAYRRCQELKMERWIQMHYQIKQREQALAIAQHRELFYWLGGFYLSAIYGCASYYQRAKRLSALAPLLPLTFVMGYYTDWAYGSKLHRIQAEANMIMEHEQELLHWPGGLPSVASIDEARMENEMEKKMHPHHM